MDETPQFLTLGEGAAARRIAVLARPGDAPGLFWLSGLMSDMASTKATVLDRFGAGRGLAVTRFDYVGHGRSSGAFTDGTVGKWLEDARAVFLKHTRGDQILVGSSLGGYIALLLLRDLIAHVPAEARRIRALLLIAPAWNMTEDLMWRRLPDSARREVETNGVYNRPSAYGAPYPLTCALFVEGRRHLIPRERWAPGRPVTILHGRLDPDVPLAHTFDLRDFIEGPDIKVVTIPDGEHRLSRPEDLERMTRELIELIELIDKAR